MGRLAKPSPGADAEELFQEAACQFLELLDDYDPDGSVYFGHYIKEKLSWRIANYRRLAMRRWLSQVPILDDRASTGQDPQLNAVVAAALDLLPVRQRDIIIRVYWQDEPIDSIAAETGVSARAVRAMRQRAENHLRSILTRDRWLWERAS